MTKRLNKTQEWRTAHLIALEWLRGAESALNRGLVPGKLSDWLASPDCCIEGWVEQMQGASSYQILTRAAEKRIKADALEMAKTRLKRGEFPTVLEHFKTR